MDWYGVYGINDHQAYNLGLLEDLHHNKPVIWALVMGRVTCQGISKAIGWPYTLTLARLRQYKQDGLVWDTEGKRSIYWNFLTEDHPWTDLKAWVSLQDKPGGLFRPDWESQE